VISIAAMPAIRICPLSTVDELMTVRRRSTL
jgi:hypothetical protein